MSGLVRGPTGACPVGRARPLSRRVPYVGPWPVRCGESAAINEDKREPHRATIDARPRTGGGGTCGPAGEDAGRAPCRSRRGPKLKTGGPDSCPDWVLSASRSSSNLPA